MATYRKRGKSVQAIVDKLGVYKSKSFPTKALASAWATALEAEIIAGKHGMVADKTIRQLFEKYRDEVAPKKPGSRWEIIRLNMYLTRKELKWMMETPLARWDTTVTARWRNVRLETVSDGTVRREWNLLSRIVSLAITEWKWMHEHPMKGVERPKPPEARWRRITQDEIDRFCFAAGYDPDTPPDTVGQRVAAVFLFAIETAMRCKEICILRWDYVDFDTNVCIVPKKSVTHTKTGGRDVPLTPGAVRILRQMEKSKNGDLVFNLSESQVDANFRKYRDQALIHDLHFHDSKHEGVTRLAEILSIQELARAVGTRNLSILMGYYNKSAADIAKSLHEKAVAND